MFCLVLILFLSNDAPEPDGIKSTISSILKFNFNSGKFLAPNIISNEKWCQQSGASTYNSINTHIVMAICWKKPVVL
jgi:uncharacterized protein (DUF608 family)